MLILVIENTEGLSMNLNFAAPTQRFFLANSCIGELEDHSYGVILSHGSTTIEVCSFPSKLSVKINISQWQLKVTKLLVRVFKWSCARRCCTSTVYKLSLHPLNWWRWCPEKKFDFDLERPAVLPRLFGFVRKCLTYLNRQPLRTKQWCSRGPFGVKPKLFVRKSIYSKIKNPFLGGKKLGNGINPK